MFSSTYIPNMKAFQFFIPEKKRQIGFQTKISVTHRFRCFTSCQPHPFYRGKIVRVQQRQLSQLQFGGFFGGGYGLAAVVDGRSERHSQLSARWECPSAFSFSRSDLLLVFQDCMESFRGGALHIDSRGLQISCQEHPLF